MLELRHISKRFGSTVALREVNLAFPERQTTALIGPSGCGKSTMLRLINRLIAPTAGAILFEGEAVTEQNVRAMRHRMGYVIQEGGLFPHLTARQNVSLLAEHLRWPAARIDGRVKELAELVRLPRETLARYPAELSGGQRQRVSLMRALLLDPEVLLLDEPLAALDPMIRYDLQSELRDIFRQLDKTVILVTHDMGEAAYFGDLIVLLREGEIVQTGAFRELINQPADPFVTEFVQKQRSLLEVVESESAGGDA